MTASAPRTNPISRLNSPARTYHYQRFAHALTNADAWLVAIVDRYSFDAGLFHPHLHVGLSRRTMPRGHRVALTQIHNRVLAPLFVADQPQAPPELRTALHTLDQ